MAVDANKLLSLVARASAIEKLEQSGSNADVIDRFHPGYYQKEIMDFITFYKGGATSTQKVQILEHINAYVNTYFKVEDMLKREAELHRAEVGQIVAEDDPKELEEQMEDLANRLCHKPGYKPYAERTIGSTWRDKRVTDANISALSKELFSQRSTSRFTISTGAGQTMPTNSTTPVGSGGIPTSPTGAGKR